MKNLFKRLLRPLARAIVNLATDGKRLDENAIKEAVKNAVLTEIKTNIVPELKARVADGVKEVAVEEINQDLKVAVQSEILKQIQTLRNRNINL